MKYKILYYACLAISAGISLHSIDIILSSVGMPSVLLHLSEFVLAIFFVCVAIYFRYKANKVKDL